MNTRVERFHKSERLCSRKQITQLISEGNIILLPFLKIVWQKSQVPMPFPARIAFSVSKKGFPEAVTRNLLKRRMREAYRRNKQTLYNLLQNEGVGIILLISYRKNIIADYNRVETEMTEMIERLSSRIKKNNK